MSEARIQLDAQVQIRRDIEANWITVDPVLRDGELAYSRDINRIKIGDGAHKWSELTYMLSVDVPGGGGGDVNLEQIQEILDQWKAEVIDPMWQLVDGDVVTDKQVIIKNNLIVEGDTSSGGEGEDTPSAGLDETKLQEYLDEHKYVTEDDIAELIPSNIATVDYVNTKFNSIDLSPYATTTELNVLANRVTSIETWMDNVGQHITYDAELDAIVINHNLIVTKDTSSGGEGEDTPASGIRGIYVNGTPYTDTDGDGFIDLGTISGGVSEITASMITSALGYTPANGANYLPLSGGNVASLTIGGNTAIHSGNIGSQSVLSAQQLAHSNGTVGVTVTNNGTVVFPTGSTYTVNDTNVAYFGAAQKGIGSSYDGALMLAYGASRNLYFYNNGLRMLINSSGNVTIGASDLAGTSYRFYIDGEANINGSSRNLYWNCTGSRYRLGFGIGSGNTNRGIYDFTNQSWMLYRDSTTNVIIPQGNVLIGTTTDSGYKLNVNGVTKASALRTTYIGIDCDADGNTSGYGSEINRFGANLYLQTREGNLYLSHSAGTTYIRGLASITGAVTMSSTLTVGGNITPSTNNAYTLGTSSLIWSHAHAYKYHVGGNYYTYITESAGYLDLVSFGNEICIGTTSNSGDIHINYRKSSSGYSPSTYYWRAGSSSSYADFYLGNLVAAGDTSSGSDIRFKDIIKDKTLKIEDIAKAPLFTFKWNDREDEAIHLGSSAQYWEKVCPWLVTGADFKSLNYATLGVAMGISLAKKAVNHEARIKELEKEIKRLKEEMRYGDR